MRCVNNVFVSLHLTEYLQVAVLVTEGLQVVALVAAISQGMVLVISQASQGVGPVADQIFLTTGRGGRLAIALLLPQSLRTWDNYLKSLKGI